MTEVLAVYEQTDGIFSVFSEDGEEYTVDVETGACTCPDAQYNEPEGGCKHLRRVELWTGERRIPEWADLDAVDPLLVDHLGLAGGE